MRVRCIDLLTELQIKKLNQIIQKIVDGGLNNSIEMYGFLESLPESDIELLENSSCTNITSECLIHVRGNQIKYFTQIALDKIDDIKGFIFENIQQVIAVYNLLLGNINKFDQIHIGDYKYPQAATTIVANALKNKKNLLTLILDIY